MLGPATFSQNVQNVQNVGSNNIFTKCPECSKCWAQQHFHKLSDCSEIHVSILCLKLLGKHFVKCQNVKVPSIGHTSLYVNMLCVMKYGKEKGCSELWLSPLIGNFADLADYFLSLTWNLTSFILQQSKKFLSFLYLVETIKPYIALKLSSIVIHCNWFSGTAGTCSKMLAS